MDKVTSNGLSITYPVRVLPFWQFHSFLNYNYQTFQGDMHGTTIDLASNNYNLRVQNKLKLPGGIGLELTYFKFSTFIWGGTIVIDGNHGMEVGLRKDFLNRMLILQISGNDVFRTNSDYFYKGNYGGIVTDGVRTFDNQRFGFSLTWNYGNQQARARERKRSDIDDELRRLGD
jgi:iron complex outermembrane recepter protein